MALDADSIDDCEILRSGRTAAVLGPPDPQRSAFTLHLPARWP